MGRTDRTAFVVFALYIICCVGCVPKKGMVEFVDVVHDHQLLTTETSNALSLSIQDELEFKKGNGAITPEEEQALLDLIERLSYMSRQSNVIADYVAANHIDDELLAKLLQSKWKE